MTKVRRTPMEKLVQRYRTQHSNLTAKRDELVREFTREVDGIDTKLADIKEILSKLEAK